MKVNVQAKITLMHSARGVQSIVKTWSSLGFEFFGAKNPMLPELLKSLHKTGKAEYTDASGTLYMSTTDKMYL